MKEIPEEIDRFIHMGTDVTGERLDVFANADRTTQLKVLAFLRGRSVDDTIDLSIFAIVLAVVIPLSTIGLPAEIPELTIVGRIVGDLIVALAVVLGVGLSVALPAIRRQERRTRATVWLRAYEDELARRHAQRGRAARRWKATH
jgi:hypothetical protein